MEEEKKGIEAGAPASSHHEHTLHEERDKEDSSEA